MKMLAHSKKGDMVKIGVSNEQGQYTWYFLDEKVKSFAATVQNGTEVEIKEEPREGQKYVTFIKATGSGGSKVNAPTTSGSGSGLSDRELQITKLSCMRAAGDAIGALQGQVDVNNIGDIMEKLYDKILKKVT